jgi:N-acetylmuramoyl-L-alanine amidase
MDYKINRHILSGDEVEYLATSSKDSGVFAENRPDTLVIHYTAGRSLDSSVNTLRDPNVKASAHLVIGRDGKIVQLIPFNKIAWHAGTSEWNGRSGLNKYSIGIEIDNAGLLTKVGDTYKTWFGTTIDKDDVLYGTHRNQSTPNYWHTFSEKQIEVVFDVCQVLRDKYGITTIVGHEEIAPERKVDPGPAFPLDKLRGKLVEDRSIDDGLIPPADGPDAVVSIPQKTGIVTASSLNFRSAPAYNAATLTAPLKYGTKVKVLKDQDGWYQIQIPQNGWVKKDYIKVDD